MSLSQLARMMRRAGRIAEPAPPLPSAAATAPAPAAPPDAKRVTPADRSGHAARRAGASVPELAGSLQARHVDCGSCNGCEIEIAATFGPVHDAERYGARLVASPRHADALLVTGVVTHNMVEPLRRTLDATPQPRLVIAVGDCAIGDSEFTDGYGVAGAVADIVPVDVRIPGCPPTPTDITAALRQITGR